MTLQECIEKIVYDNPEKKRIIRSGNRMGWVDVHFTYEKGMLMVNDWRVRLGEGMILITKKATFQTSEHTDWILV